MGNLIPIHLKVTEDDGLCSVEGCHYYREQHYNVGEHTKLSVRVRGLQGRLYHILCRGHRRLARERYNGTVPIDYIPFGVGSNTLDDNRYWKVCNCDYTLRLPPFLTHNDGIQTFSIEGYRKKRCVVAGCNNSRRLRSKTFAGSLCSYHYNLWADGQPKLKSKCVVRQKCCIDGCGRLAAHKGLYNGERRYSKYCEKHRRERYGSNPRKSYNTNKCSVCGWGGPCDKHRIKPGKDGGGYIRGNVIVVCPNCHRLSHRGLMGQRSSFNERRKTILSG